MMPLPFVFVFLFALSSCTSNPFLDDPKIAADEARPHKTEETPSEPIIRKKVLVLPFLNRSNFQNESLVRVALFDIQQAVTNSPDLLLVKPGELDAPEPLYSAAGEYHFQRVFEYCKSAGISGVIVGRIDEVTVRVDRQDTGLLGAKQHFASARIYFQLFDVNAEKEVFYRSTTAEVRQERVNWLEARGPSGESEDGKEAVSQALKKVLDRFPAIARRLSWVGRIARVDLNRYFITGGEQTGVRPGQLLRVFESGSIISDPSTGYPMGYFPGRFKGLLKVTQTFGPDSAVAVLYTGAGFHRQDRVEIHNPEPIQ